MKNLVTLATYEQSKTADFLKKNLDKEHIECYSASFGSSEDTGEKVRIQVKKEDVERAVKVLLRIQEEHGMALEKIVPGNLGRKIIVPTNFSKGSEYACHYAIHLARKIHAEIKLLHVYENPLVDLGMKEYPNYLDYMRNTVKETEEKAKADIVAFTNKMKAYLRSQGMEDLQIHSAIVMGSIVGKIREISKEYKPDVIVLGTEGKREDTASIFSGLVKEIVSGMDVPVYAIPGDCSPEDFKRMNILYATDFNEKDHHSLNRLLQIVDPFDKQVTCIHVDTAHHKAKKERMDELNGQLKEEYGQYDIRCRLIEDEDVYHGLKEFVEKNQVNLLSFTVHKRRIFEILFKPNLFKKILQESSIPILLFPS